MEKYKDLQNNQNFNNLSIMFGEVKLNRLGIYIVKEKRTNFHFD